MSGHNPEVLYQKKNGWWQSSNYCWERFQLQTYSWALYFKLYNRLKERSGLPYPYFCLGILQREVNCAHPLEVCVMHHAGPNVNHPAHTAQPQRKRTAWDKSLNKYFSFSLPSCRIILRIYYLRSEGAQPTAEDVVSLTLSQACFCLREVPQQNGHDDRATGCKQWSHLNCNLLPPHASPPNGAWFNTSH